MTLPLLTTARLLLRQRHEDDIPAILRMDVDPEVMRFLDGPRTDTVEHEKEVRARIRKDFGPGLGYWSVFRRDRPDDFLGYVSLHTMSDYTEVELGYRFRRATWCQGIATESAAACLDHAFRTLALPEVVAVVDPDNHASLRVIAKLGFRAAGRRHAYRKDLLLYRLEQTKYPRSEQVSRP
jgi:RimJ/RimL family protein N-acetyltransferase